MTRSLQKDESRSSPSSQGDRLGLRVSDVRRLIAESVQGGARLTRLCSEPEAARRSMLHASFSTPVGIRRGSPPGDERRPS